MTDAVNLHSGSRWEPPADVDTQPASAPPSDSAPAGDTPQRPRSFAARGKATMAAGAAALTLLGGLGGYVVGHNTADHGGATTGVGAPTGVGGGPGQFPGGQRDGFGQDGNGAGQFPPDGVDPNSEGSQLAPGTTGTPDDAGQGT